MARKIVFFEIIRCFTQTPARQRIDFYPAFELFDRIHTDPAAALNTLAAAGTDTLDGCRAPRLLTPHPGEMERLFPRGDRPRRAWAEAFCDRFPAVTLLLKGARTIIKQGNQPAAFNPTGHPGMASGGLGDLLTGLAAALIAQGRSTYEAACAGSWLAGRAAELALESQSPESFRASDAIEKLGAAFDDLRG